ncbi:hypothetical protein N9L06_05495 [Mariniblastus sp.]|nr:hypothetical protein [Mariniblastus sp.]
MKFNLKIVSLVALLAIVVSGILYFLGAISHDVMNGIALIATIAWFIATPLWMGRERSLDAAEAEI